MKRSMLLEICVQAEFHTLLLVSLFFLFAGHNQPGGGFVGGLVAGAAISLRFLAGGIEEVRSTTRFAPWTILGAGIALSVGTAIAPMLIGRPVLSSLGTEFDVVVLGEIYASTTLLFDVGVYAVVVGLVFMVFEAFAEEPSP